MTDERDLPSIAKVGAKKVLLVDDHPIVRERLAELINDEPDLVVCGEADDAQSTLAAIKRQPPDVAIIDLSLKDTYGIELIKDLGKRYPKLPTLVLSMHDETVYAERALRAGAKGYVTKQEATQQVLKALRKVLAGGIYFSEPMAEAVLGRVAGIGPTASGSPVDKLSDRELEVFHLLGEGKAVREIAELLFISPKTVEAHRENIKKKLKFKTSAELLRYAIQTTLHNPGGNASES